MPSHVFHITARGREAWVARIQRNGRQITRTFSEAIWGKAHARQFAIEAAARMIQKYPLDRHKRDPRKRTTRNTTGRAGVYKSAATWGGVAWPYYGVTYTDRGQRKTQRFYWHRYERPLDRGIEPSKRRALKDAAAFRAHCERAGMFA